MSAHTAPRAFPPGSPCGFFAVGTALAACSSLWWFAVITGIAPVFIAPHDVASATGHAVLMTLGTFPPFIAGFVCTALPRWIRVDPKALGQGFGSAWAYAASLILTAVGMPFGLEWMAPGLAAAALTWMVLTTRVALAVHHSRAEDRLHALGLLTAMIWMAVAFAVAAFACAMERPATLHASARLALGFGVGTAYAFATHRMTPFLHAPCEHCPRAGGLAAVLLSLWLITMHAIATTLEWPWPPALHHTALFVCMATGLMLLVTTFQADVRRASRAPMMRHLRRGVFWLTAALWAWTLAMLPSVRLRWPGLDSAALHMLILGFMGTTLLAQATRIATTQRGLAPVVGRYGEQLHVLLQIVVVTRAGAAIWPQTAATTLPTSVLGWLLVLVLWGMRWLRPPSAAPRRRRSSTAPTPSPDRLD